MKFLTDDHFVIGADHVAAGTPCEDYATSGVDNDAAFAIVSDGCSQGHRTDVGSRVVVLTTQMAITACRSNTEVAPIAHQPNEINTIQRLLMNNAKQALGLTRDDLVATCVYAHLAPKGGFINLQGDGVIALVYRDGSSVLKRYNWTMPGPFYPIFIDSGLSRFVAGYGGDTEAQTLVETVRKYSVIGTWLEEEVLHTLGQGIAGITIHISESEIRDELAFVAVFTDGAMHVEGMEWFDVVQELLAFKVLGGEFATRRMIRFLKDSKSVGRGPLDDLAYAVIQLRPEE